LKRPWFPNDPQPCLFRFLANGEVNQKIPPFMSSVTKIAVGNAPGHAIGPGIETAPRGHGERTESRGPISDVKVSILTGCADKPYALGLASALMARGISFDFIGSDYVDGPALHGSSQVNFLNLRGDQNPAAGPITKALRVLKYYARLVAYAATAKPKIFHILWHNKFDLFDRTLLLAYYKLLGKKLVFTAHNVNAGLRDSNNSWLNQLSLAIQYRLVDHIFVHTEKMKKELGQDFGVPEAKATVIPFGINNTLPNTGLSGEEARKRLGLAAGDKVILFFGNIAPYKGLDYLVDAWCRVASHDTTCRLLIAGNPRAQDMGYWNNVREKISRAPSRNRITEKIEYIAEEEVEVYFKAADVLILPYAYIFQSGVLFLGYSFGLPVIAADVGSLKEEIVEGETGFMFQAKNADDLAQTIQKYFQSDLYRQLDQRRGKIRDYANERYSWSKVGVVTSNVYANLLAG
jgi:D-inositol-3-phosphate glycosyltransferase